METDKAAPELVDAAPDVRIKGPCITLGAQPNSISCMLEGPQDASLARIAPAGKGASSHIDADQASYASSSSGSPSGDENTDMNNSLDTFHDIQKSETRQSCLPCGAVAPLGMSLERTAAAETLVDEELHGMV